MPQNRKNIKVSEATFNELNDDKPDGVTWDYYLTKIRVASGGGDGTDA